MLGLLDKLDNKYNRINNLGHWTKRENPQILALITAIVNLQAQLSSVKHLYSSLQALLAKTTPTLPTTPHHQTKLEKLPPKPANEPEVITFKNFV